MNYEQAKKEVAKLMRELSPKHSMHTVFKDFTTLAACTISNSVDKSQWQEREDRYMRIIQKYERSEANVFAEILGLVVTGMSDRFGDFLGELFMELGLSNDETGQFFTPYDLCRMMAELTPADTEEYEITLNEPAVGSGSMIIAYAETLHKQDVNFQRQLKVTCNDVDFDLARMCYVQLSLYGVDAIVQQGNTLSMEFNETWYTPMHLLNKIRDKQEKDSREALRKMGELIQEDTRKPQELVQMSLF